MKLVDIISEVSFYTYSGMVKITHLNSTPTEIAELIRALPGVTTVTMAGSTGENTETYKIKLISQKPGIEAFQALKKNALTKYTPIKIVEIGKNTIERK